MVKTFLKIQLRHYGYQQSTVKSESVLFLEVKMLIRSLSFVATS